MLPRLRLLRDRWPGRPAFDTAVSRALMLRAAEGEIPETLRIARPDPIVAFGRQDAAANGFPEAIRAAERHGFASVSRLAGGRAAVFHENTISFARAVPDADPTSRTFARFEEMAAILAEALRSLGIDARVGEVPGEYCPGDYSVNARGRSKLVGIGQRLVMGAAHVGGVVVVSEADRVRDVLVEVYEALELEWDPATAGSVTDEVSVTYDEVTQAVIDQFASRFELEESSVDKATLDLATELEPAHRAPPA